MNLQLWAAHTMIRFGPILLALFSCAGARFADPQAKALIDIQDTSACTRPVESFLDAGHSLCLEDKGTMYCQYKLSAPCEKGYWHLYLYRRACHTVWRMERIKCE